MVDIRKIQENVIYECVKARSDGPTAREVVYGEEQKTGEDNNEEWVKSSMRRLESKFEEETVKEIRMSC